MGLPCGCVHPMRTSFHDSIQGDIPRTSSAIAAISLFVAPTGPAYQLAVVVDDAAQGEQRGERRRLTMLDPQQIQPRTCSACRIRLRPHPTPCR